MTTTLSLVILCALVALVLASKTERAVLLTCDSGQYTNGGECCLECPPGEGVVKKCGATQTVCAQCLDSETFSENYSHTEQCRPCTQCTGLMRLETPCTDSNDAVCVCNYNFFFDAISGRCEPCTVCPVGEGVFAHCEHNHDTVCEECVDDTFSDRESSLEPCLPCAICDDETEIQLALCSPTRDSICHNPNLPTDISPTSDMASSPPPFTNYFPPDGSDSPLPGGETTTSSAGSPRFLGHGLNENLIPIYCSILAAVVVGLVAYIVFKRWNSCKQNKQAANNRAATNNQMVTPEGEKLHSDSGISVDSQSLQEQQQHQQQQQQQAHAEVQTQPSRSHTQEQIVVRVDGDPQSDSAPPEV
ncbi:tumor necrosis factor receptor superfamily member 16-like [Seriola lalandi dorsalis]|uniref:tumor necrosis factor receptor superfamily member 16-like n=1 Tax=Seriola lalandi dorsalis TaxID=1841481 RepID=UPI000C6FA0ED|nr:tumor necrosis factor receptor superfamily member 16-like [Seriola lalandi dorsalis]